MCAVASNTLYTLKQNVEKHTDVINCSLYDQDANDVQVGMRLDRITSKPQRMRVPFTTLAEIIRYNKLFISESYHYGGKHRLRGNLAGTALIYVSLFSIHLSGMKMGLFVNKNHFSTFNIIVIVLA